jgi:protease II
MNHTTLNSPTCQMLPVSQPNSALQPTLGRKNGVEYSIDERAGQLYAITNDEAINSKLLTIDLKTKKVRVLFPQDVFVPRAAACFQCH